MSSRDKQTRKGIKRRAGALIQNEDEENIPTLGSIEHKLASQEKEIKVLTTREGQLLNQATIDGDSIRILNQKVRQLQSESDDNDKIISTMSAELVNQKEIINGQADAIVRLTLSIEELKRLVVKFLCWPDP